MPNHGQLIDLTFLDPQNSGRVFSNDVPTVGVHANALVVAPDENQSGPNLLGKGVIVGGDVIACYSAIVRYYAIAACNAISRGYAIARYDVIATDQ